MQAGTMLRLPLLFSFVATCFICSGAKEDVVKGAFATLTGGANLLKDVTSHTMSTVENIENIMKQVEKMMLNITELNGGVGIDTTDLIPHESLVKFDGEKKSLRLAKRKLRPMMSETITASDKLLDNLIRWDNHVEDGNGKTYLKEQVCMDG